MSDYPDSSLDARGRRKTSPAANEFYSRKILTVDGFGGAKEDEINRIAKRLLRARAAGSVSQELALKGKLVEKCMRFYYTTGDNVGVRDDGVLHEGVHCRQRRSSLVFEPLNSPAGRPQMGAAAARMQRHLRRRR